MQLIRSVKLAAVAVYSMASVALNAQAVASIQQTSSSKTSASTLVLNRIISVNFDNIPLIDALNEIGTKGQVQISYLEHLLAGKKVTFKTQNVTVRDALIKILQNTGLGFSGPVNGQIVVTERNNRARWSQGIIAGKVTDAKTGKGIAGANVSVDADTRGVISDEDGSYRVTGISMGNHVVTVRLVGYAKQARSVIVSEGAISTVDFKLEPSASVLDQVIVTGTVVSTELKAVPSAITVITAKQIEERGITHIEQLFRGDIPGLFAVEQGTWNKLGEVTMFSRGATAISDVSAGTENGTNPIKIYIDGVEMANPKFLSQIDPKSIERLEILSGPQASTIYGSNAINGVMQIFTKRGRSSRPQLTLNLTSGFAQNNFSNGLAPTYVGDVNLSETEGRLSYNFGGFTGYVGSWTPALQTFQYGGNGGLRMTGGNLSVDLSTRVSITRNMQRGADFQTLTRASETGLRPIGLGAGRWSQTLGTANGQTFGLTIGYNAASWWSHEIVLGADANATDFSTIEPSYSLNDTLFNLDRIPRVRTSERYTTTFILPLTSLAKITATFGGDHWRAEASRTMAASGKPTGLLNSPQIEIYRPEKNHGGFVQGQFAIFNALFFTYGLRAEWNPNYGDDAQPNLAPRYGFAYTRSVGDVTAKVRASYGRATRPPAQYLKLAVAETNPPSVAIYGPYNFVLANPDLGPEFQQGGEGGLEIYLGNRGSLVITRYNQTIDGAISILSGIDSVRSLIQNPAGCTPQASGYCYVSQVQYMNLGSIRNQGWELQGSVNLGPLTTQGTYSWTKSRVIGITERYRSLFQSNTEFQPGRPFRYVAEHTWATTFSYSKRASNVSLTLNGVGEIFRLSDELSIYTGPLRLQGNKIRMSLPSGYRPKGAGYIRSHLNAAQRFSPHIEGTLQVQNLLDSYQSDFSVNNATIGRQTKIGVRIRLN